MPFRRGRHGKHSPEPEADAEGPVEGTPDSSTASPAASGGAGAEGDGEEAGGGLLSGTRAALRPVKKRHVVIASLGLLGVAFAGVLLFSAFSFWWTSQPSFCDKCHVMNTYVDTWQASAHTGINCEHCHINPGLFNFMGGKIAGLQVVANYITGNFDDDSFSASVSNAACLQCHGDLLVPEKVTFDDGISVSHRHIMDNGGKCMDCHSTVAHGDAIPVGAATFPTMDRCMKCHDGTTAPTDCVLCHESGPPNPDADEPTASAAPTPGSA
jgi:nitrate/TMAO reductase-like tetraheme cytochrome c subunit